MYAKDVMSEEIVSIAPTATAFEAAQALVNARMTAPPVLDEAGLLVGIIS